MADDDPSGWSKKPSYARFSRALFALSAVLSALLGSSAAEAADSTAELEATLRVCTAGPAVAVARAEQLRGEAEVTAAGVLPNPSLFAEHQRSLRGPSEQESVLGVSVPLGLGGARFALQDAAASRRVKARASAALTLFDSALAFRAAYLRAVADQARVGVLGEQQGALEALGKIIEGLAKGGEAAGYDLLRQRAQARAHRSLLEVARARAAASRAALAAWVEHPLPLSSAELRAMADPERWVRSAGEAPRHSTQLRVLEAAARASAFEARAAERRWVPELDVFAGYRAVTAGDATGQGISLGLSLPLTFFDHGQGEAARAEGEGAVVLAQATKLKREQRADARAARVKLEGLSVALAEAEQASSQTAAIRLQAQRLFGAGEASITELLEAFRATEDAELSKLECLEEIARTRLELMRASGTMFDSRLDRTCGSDGGRGVER